MRLDVRRLVRDPRLAVRRRRIIGVNGTPINHKVTSRGVHVNGASLKDNASSFALVQSVYTQYLCKHPKQKRRKQPSIKKPSAKQIKKIQSIYDQFKKTMSDQC
jgi:hypothetical protein